MFNARFTTPCRDLLRKGIALVLMVPLMASGEPWDDQANKTEQIFHGPMVRSIAIIAVIAAGVTCLSGKLPLKWFICILIGVLLMAKAEAVVGYLWS